MLQVAESRANPETIAIGETFQRGFAALVIGPEDSADIAVVALNTGRILKRIKAPVAPTNLGASPDGATLYVSAGGSISAIAIDTGHAEAHRR